MFIAPDLTTLLSIQFLLHANPEYTAIIHFANISMLMQIKKKNES
jgi:hypothetical protein